MSTTPTILDRVIGLEAMAATMSKEAAMLRRELSAGGQPIASRKGSKNIEIMNAARTRYKKRQLQK